MEVTAFCITCWTATEKEADRASKFRFIILLFGVEVLSGGLSSSGSCPVGRDFLATRVVGRAARGHLTSGKGCTKQMGSKINV